MKGCGLIVGYRTQLSAFRVDREDLGVQTSGQCSMNEEMILGVDIKFRWCRHKSVSVPRITGAEITINKNIDIPNREIRRLTDSVHALEMVQPE